MAKQSLSQTIALIGEDIRFRCAYENKSPTLFVVLKLMLNPGVVAVAGYRLQTFFDVHYLYPLGWLLSLGLLILFGVQIHSKAKIRGGLLIVHANSIFIGKEVTIGSRCILFHQNSIGGSCFATESGVGLPVTTIGNNVIFGAGACAYGNINIGDGCRLAVNTVVETDALAGSIVFGVPGRVVAKNDRAEPLQP